jgi:DNA-binding XRE family transcriptional regulator
MGQDSKNSVNQRLRYARMKRFLTVEKAAQGVDVSPTTYTRWEQGHQKPHLSALGLLCDFFKATPDQLGFGDMFDGYEEPLPRKRTPVSDSGGVLHGELMNVIHEVFAMHNLPEIGVIVRRTMSNFKNREVVATLEKQVPKDIQEDIRMLFERKTGYSLTFEFRRS